MTNEHWTRLDVSYTYDGYSYKAVEIWNEGIENKPVAEIIQEAVEMALEEAVEKTLRGIY